MRFWKLKKFMQHKLTIRNHLIQSPWKISQCPWFVLEKCLKSWYTPGFNSSRKILLGTCIMSVQAVKHYICCLRGPQLGIGLFALLVPHWYFRGQSGDLETKVSWTAVCWIFVVFSVWNYEICQFIDKIRIFSKLGLLT